MTARVPLSTVLLMAVLVASAALGGVVIGAQIGGDRAASTAPMVAATPTSTPTSTPAPTGEAMATPAPAATATLNPAPTPTPTTSADAGHTAASIEVDGAGWHLLGVNVAWHRWACDFGCGDGGGVSQPAARAAIGERFAELQKSDVHVARWWTFEGDAWQIERDAQGAPLRLSPQVYEDFDAAIELAREFDLRYVFVLFSAPRDLPAAWLTDPGQRAQLARVLTPLFERYADEPRVLAWEIFNEPEWDIWNGVVAQQPVVETTRALVEAVRAASTTYVTVGSAMLDGLPMWTDLGLDFYQAHWYDFMNSPDSPDRPGGNWCARCTDYAEVRERYDLDAPLVIGEFFAGPTTDAAARYRDFYEKGYAGSWAWSLFPGSTNDGMVIDLAAAAALARTYADTGPR